MTFTYITITYNAVSTVSPTLESILRQQYPQIEHIIVDGASTDATLDLVRRYQEASRASGNGHTVRIVSEPDKGIYDAMNKGLALATGDYVCFLNAGDSLPEELQVSAIADMLQQRCGDQDLPAVVYGDTNLVDEDRRLIGRRRLSPPERLTWRSFASGMLVCHQSFYARRNLAQQMPYNLAYRHSADFDWCIRVMKAAVGERPFLNTRMVLTNYLNEGHTTKNHRASLLERYHIMCGYYGTLPTIIRHIGFLFRNVAK